MTDMPSADAEEFSFSITEVAATDFGDLELVMQDHIIEEGEVLKEEIDRNITRMRQSLTQENTEDYHYLVARNAEGKVIGMMGFRFPEQKMMQYVQPEERAAEMINAYVKKEYKGKGVGSALLEQIRELASSKGYDHLIWNSGTRYEEAWRFYTKKVGKPIADHVGYYAEGESAMVWKVKLV